MLMSRFDDDKSPLSVDLRQHFCMAWIFRLDERGDCIQKAYLHRLLSVSLMTTVCK